MPTGQAISEELKDFLERCLCKDPFERADAEELLHHPFITQEARSCFLPFFYLESSGKNACFNYTGSKICAMYISRTAGYAKLLYLFSAQTLKQL